MNIFIKILISFSPQIIKFSLVDKIKSSYVELGFDKWIIIYVKLLQLWNILFIYRTFEVLKLDKSKVINKEQLKNILFIFITCEVSKLDISK